VIKDKSKDFSTDRTDKSGFKDKTQNNLRTKTNKLKQDKGCA
jgi:hypothetical protein